MENKLKKLLLSVIWLLPKVDQIVVGNLCIKGLFSPLDMFLVQHIIYLPDNLSRDGRTRRFIKICSANFAISPDTDRHSKNSQNIF